MGLPIWKVPVWRTTAVDNDKTRLLDEKRDNAPPIAHRATDGITT
jgi:hypothetical protein